MMEYCINPQPSTSSMDVEETSNLINNTKTQINTRQFQVEQFLRSHHPILIEGPGPSDNRDAQVVASIVIYNIKRHFRLKPNVHDKPLLLITQGDPYVPKGISAISRIVAKELKIDRCLVYLDEEMDESHGKNADRVNVKLDIKYSEIKAMLISLNKDESSKGYHDAIVQNVKEKMKKYQSSSWVENYALLQEVTKATLKKLCGSITIAHTVARPTDYNVTKFFCVGVDLGLIDKDVDMVKYSCELFDLLEEEKYVEALAFFERTDRDPEVKRANVLFVDGQFGNTSLIMAAFLQAPVAIFEKLFEIGGTDLSIVAENKWRSNALIDACLKEHPDTETIDFLLSKAKETVKDVSKFVCFQKEDGCNALHSCCERNQPVPGGNVIIQKLIELGGVKLCKSQNKNGQIPLGLLYSDQTGKIDDIQYLCNQWQELDPFLETVPISLLNSAKSSGYDVSKDVFLQKFMNKIYASRQYVFLIMLDFYAAAVILSCLSWGLMYLVTDQESPLLQNIVTVLITLSLLWMCCRETMEFWTTPFLEFVSNPVNYFDSLQIIFGLLTLFVIANHTGGVLSETSQVFLMVATAISWVRIIFVSGQLSYSISVFSSALVKIVVRLIPFLIVTFVLLAGFAHLNFIAVAQRSIQSNPNNQIAPFVDGIHVFYLNNLQTFLTSEFEFDENQVYDRIFVSQILFAFVIGILLLNILIAVISNEFTEVMANSKRAVWHNRLKFLVEVHNTFNGISRLKCFKSYWSVSNEDENEIPKVQEDDDTFSTNQLEYNDKIERFDFLHPMYAGMKGTVFEEKFKDRYDLPDKFSSLVKVTNWFWKVWQKDEDEIPVFSARMKTYFYFSTIDQIAFPGKVAVNMFLGLKINEEADSILGKFLWASCYITMVLSALIIFPLGFLTAGIAWPDVIRRGFFSIKEEVNHTELERLIHITRMQQKHYQGQIDQLRQDMKR